MLGHDVLESVVGNLARREHLLGQRRCMSTHRTKRAFGRRSGREVRDDGVQIGLFECRHHQGSCLLACQVLVVGKLGDDVALEDPGVCFLLHDEFRDC